MVKCIKVELKEAERVKTEIIALRLFDFRYKVKKEGNYIFIPITKKYSNYKILNKDLEKKETRISFKDLIKKKFGKKSENINTSYDLIGDVAVIEIDDNVEDKKYIGEMLLKVNKNVNIVVRKIGGHEGEYRIQKYEAIAIRNNRNMTSGLETIHTESGVKVKLDLNKVYFTSRWASERLRIAKLVKTDERLLVMFSGVGILPLIIAKHSEAKEIYCIEINPVACKYAEENVKINKIKNIKLFCDDVREVLSEIRLNEDMKFDRIIMPLPKDAVNFLDIALKFINKNGIIHLYLFSHESEINKTVSYLEDKYKFKVFNIVKTGQNKPKNYRYCLDIANYINS